MEIPINRVDESAEDRYQRLLASATFLAGVISEQNFGVSSIDIHEAADEIVINTSERFEEIAWVLKRHGASDLTPDADINFATIAIAKSGGGPIPLKSDRKFVRLADGNKVFFADPLRDALARVRSKT